MTTQIYAGVREILAGPDWEPVSVTDHGAFFTIAGLFRGTAHSGSRKDWASLAVDLDRIAREVDARIAEALAEKAAAEAEPVPAVVVVEAEPEPAPVVIEEAPAEPEPQPEPAPAPDLRQELDALKDRNAELEAELASLREERPFPTMTEKLADYDAVGDEGMPEDLAQIMTGDETLEAAVDRMTPGIEELLDLAQVVSEQSLEKAIATIPAERFNDWTERLLDERARLRLKRGTDEENITRENLINRVANTFARVGAKR